MSNLYRLAGPFMLCGLGILYAQTAAGGFTVDLDAQGVALKGHDPVAYFTDAKPTPGSPRYTASFEDARYRFASADNRDRFTEDPGRYTASYGGYCALGISRSKKVAGDPKVWKIVDGKLYINSSAKSFGIWSEDIPGNIKAADEIWPVIKDRDPASFKQKSDKVAGRLPGKGL